MIRARKAVLVAVVCWGVVALWAPPASAAAAITATPNTDLGDESVAVQASGFPANTEVGYCQGNPGTRHPSRGTAAARPGSPRQTRQAPSVIPTSRCGASSSCRAWVETVDCAVEACFVAAAVFSRHREHRGVRIDLVRSRVAGRTDQEPRRRTASSATTSTTPTGPVSRAPGQCRRAAPGRTRCRCRTTAWRWTASRSTPSRPRPPFTDPLLLRLLQHHVHGDGPGGDAQEPVPRTGADHRGRDSAWPPTRLRGRGSSRQATFTSTSAARSDTVVVGVRIPTPA